MFGIYRYILAHMVVLSHLWRIVPTGSYAVFGFYVLSGYLITLILNQTYTFSASGLKRFLINRALRIYPAYLTVLLLALSLVVWIPAIAQQVHGAIRLPNSPADWLSNFFIFGLKSVDLGGEALLIPPAWALHIELIFYGFMALLLSRHRRIVIVWFLASLTYTTIAIFSKASFIDLYYSLPAVSLPFSMGAMIYFFRDSLCKFISKWHIVPATILMILNVIAGTNRAYFLATFYVSLGLSAWIVMSLCQLNPRSVPSWLARSDKLLGDLSYPVYLCHWHIAILVVWLQFSGNKPEASFLFFSCLPFINLAAYLIVVFVERRVDGLRNRVRKIGNMTNKLVVAKVSDS